MTAAATPEGWPFWAPSDMAAVERALDVAGLRPGERLVDLGCGDGQVLVAAARRGAHVTGVEVDDELADEARANLAAAGVDGVVVVDDVFTHPLGDADVLFTYLSPATLQRLSARLQTETKPGARLVTVDYAVTGFQPAATDGRIRLYRLPAKRARRRRSGGAGGGGWPSAGLVTTVAPDVQSLTVLVMHHGGGPVRIRADRALRRAVTVQVGADDAAPGDPVAVDLRWEAQPAGTVVLGRLDAAGVGPFTVATVVSDEPHDVWDLNELGVARLHARIAATRARRAPRPASVAELIDACEDERYGAEGDADDD